MTLFEEMILATRGIFALISNKKDAAKYFDFSAKGLAGATIALLISLSLSAFLPAFLGHVDPQGLMPSQAMIFTSTIYLIQIGATTIIFNQFQRLDGLLPYLVADFWSTFIITIIMLIPALMGIKSDFLMLILAISILIIKINILRLIIKLPSAWHIVGFFVAQLMAGFVGLIILSAIFGVDPMLSNQLQ